MANLTPKQQQAVEEYLVDFNQTQAVIRAGYSAKTAAQIASRLFSLVKVQDALAARIEQRAEHTEIDQDWVIAKLVENVNRAMQAVPVLDRDGEPTGEYTYQGAVANKALELLGRHTGGFTERHEVTDRKEFVFLIGHGYVEADDPRIIEGG